MKGGRGDGCRMFRRTNGPPLLLAFPCEEKKKSKGKGQSVAVSHPVRDPSTTTINLPSMQADDRKAGFWLASGVLDPSTRLGARHAECVHEHMATLFPATMLGL